MIQHSPWSLAQMALEASPVLRPECRDKGNAQLTRDPGQKTRDTAGAL